MHRDIVLESRHQQRLCYCVYICLLEGRTVRSRETVLEIQMNTLSYLFSPRCRNKGRCDHRMGSPCYLVGAAVLPPAFPTAACIDFDSYGMVLAYFISSIAQHLKLRQIVARSLTVLYHRFRDRREQELVIGLRGVVMSASCFRFQAREKLSGS
jgi:hypothetical protein